jgi:hypothetical protein
VHAANQSSSRLAGVLLGALPSGQPDMAMAEAARVGAASASRFRGRARGLESSDNHHQLPATSHQAHQPPATSHSHLQAQQPAALPQKSPEPRAKGQGPLVSPLV